MNQLQPAIVLPAARISARGAMRRRSVRRKEDGTGMKDLDRVGPFETSRPVGARHTMEKRAGL
ncbi:hypothetical protein GCM10011611_22860 [Aliidongia dinghuensis]|uniref:Uncharacterized protein n=1 Tax=Aliidongia dinghuensis TaxID=1867774 RepID=A0A8J2YU40_9PROT|nr:hypothetical protein GCM10011611_22860 [Aliidongia dinghuensis]